MTTHIPFPDFLEDMEETRKTLSTDLLKLVRLAIMLSLPRGIELMHSVLCMMMRMPYLLDGQILEPIVKYFDGRHFLRIFLKLPKDLADQDTSKFNYPQDTILRAEFFSTIFAILDGPTTPEQREILSSAFALFYNAAALFYGKDVASIKPALDMHGRWIADGIVFVSGAEDATIFSDIQEMQAFTDTAPGVINIIAKNLMAEITNS